MGGIHFADPNTEEAKESGGSSGQAFEAPVGGNRVAHVTEVEVEFTHVTSN